MPIPYLPEELWRKVVMWWPGNFELKWVCEVRRLNKAFADTLKYRVATHMPSAKLFVEELKLGDVYNARNTPHGQIAYGRAMNMIYCRNNESPSCRRLFIQTELHEAVLRWYENWGVLMPLDFTGFLARLNNCWGRYYVSRTKNASLETQFRRVFDTPGLPFEIIVADPTNVTDEE